MKIVIIMNTTGSLPGKLADAELHFTTGLLDGLKLAGFAVWEQRGGRALNITFPARQYSVNGERRSFALLRPIGDGTIGTSDAGILGTARVRELVLDAFNQVRDADQSQGAVEVSL